MLLLSIFMLVGLVLTRKESNRMLVKREENVKVEVHCRWTISYVSPFIEYSGTMSASNINDLKKDKFSIFYSNFTSTLIIHSYKLFIQLLQEYLLF